MRARRLGTDFIKDSNNSSIQRSLLILPLIQANTNRRYQSQINPRSYLNKIRLLIPKNLMNIKETASDVRNWLSSACDARRAIEPIAFYFEFDVATVRGICEFDGGF
jgi:hypothetical protein